LKAPEAKAAEETMRKSPFAIAAGAALIFSISMCGAVLAAEPGTAKPSTTGSTKPNMGKGPAEQKSLPSSATDATTTKHTGSTAQDHTVKSMNENAKTKVETEGK
jgi:hypothetical protein